MTSPEEASVTQAQFAVSHSIAFVSHIGKTHQVNQDAGGAWTVTRHNGVPASLLITADGVSAGKHSEEASRLVVDSICAALLPLLQDESRGLDTLLEALASSARAANHAVAQRPYVSAGTADATTLVAALCLGTEGGGVWCGDSRVYRLARGSAERLTLDHSWAEGVVHHGIMTPEQARNDPRAHMITRWLGPPDDGDPGIDVFRVSLTAGEAVLCCSDGLYAYFSPPAGEESEMEQVLLEETPDLRTATEKLVTLALERGGHDDISAAVLRIGV